MSRARDLADGTFSGAFSADSPTLVVDDTNNNVGIGIASPTFTAAYGGVHVHSTYPEIHLTGTDSGSTAGDGFKIQKNSANNVYLWNYENAFVAIGANNTQRARFDSDGLKFGSDTAAANALDDYEEGTWTPTVNSGSVTIAHASYVKVGNIVTITSDLTDITDSTSTSSVFISGLPYTSSSQGRWVGSAIARYVTKSNVVNISPYITQSQSEFGFLMGFDNGGTWSYLQYSNAGATWDMYFTLTYRTA